MSRRSTTTLEREFVERKGIYPNLDYPSGPAYNLIGLRHPDLHAAVRRGAGRRLDGAHHGAGRVERAHPSAVGLRGPDERHIEGFVDEAGTSTITLRAAEAEG
jgi:citrate synthase